MEFRNYYKALGVADDAPQDEIKRAFRKLARKYHPDVNTNADAGDKFKEVTEAYEVLGDPEKRAAYDELARSRPSDAGGFEVPPGWDGGFEFSSGPGSGPGPGAEAFSDFFETLFRQSSDSAGRQPRSYGMDSTARLQVSIEDAYTGAKRALNLRMPVVGPDGVVSLQERKISITLPKGLQEGQHIRVPGQGDGAAGDLFLEISFAPHPVYHPDGRDLYMDLPIAPWEAALGGHIVMPTPDGKVDLRIPKNARSGQKLRLKGKGLPGHPPGDIYANLLIVNPKVSSDRAREAFEHLAEAMPFDPRSHLTGG